MKRIVPILSFVAIAAVVLSACGNKGEETKAISYADTAGLSQFQQWKYMNERAQADQYFQQAVQTTPVNQAPARTTTRKTNYGSGSMNTVSQNQAKTTQKKGWSKAAKYGVIGGGGGAVIGAVVNKRNRVAGGVIGGIVGGGLGYLIGRHQDKKDGRY